MALGIGGKSSPPPLAGGGGGSGRRQGHTQASHPETPSPHPEENTTHTAIVPPGTTATALTPLPIRALRLPDDIIKTLHRLGLTRIGQLMAAPRAPLTRRFGTTPLRRLDQAPGKVFEPIRPPSTCWS